MKMKKLAALGAAMVMSLALGLTAFASSSPVSTGSSSVKGAVDKNGNAVEVTLKGGVDSAIVNAIKSDSALKAVLGDAYVEGMTVVDVVDVQYKGNKEDFPITVTFNVPGVTASTKVALVHYTNGAWKADVTDVKAGNGTITGTFSSFSPVAIVVDKSAADSSVKSPKTGETTMPIVMMAIGVLAVGGVYVMSRKSRA